MKKATLLILTILHFSAFAQQAAEIDPKSIKLPRYADLTAITSAIASPQQGMMVYNNSTASNWYYNGSAWANMAGSLALPFSQSQALNSGGLFSVTNTTSNAAGMASALKGEFFGTPTNLISTGIGVHGVAVKTGGLGQVYGVLGETSASDGAAVNGRTTAIFSTGTGVLGSSDAGKGVWGTANSGIGGYFSSTSGYALVTGTGNVGIGISNPSAKLDVAGSLKIANGSQGADKVLVSDIDGLTSWQKISSGSISAPLNFDASSSTPIFSATNTGTGRAGFFSINNTGSSANALRVESNSSGYGAFYLRTTGSGRAAVIDATNSIALTASTTSTSEVAQFTALGTGGGLWVYTTNTSNNSDMVIGDAKGGAGVVGFSTTGVGGKFSSSSGYALVTDLGNVGIGTPTPTAKLDVNGQAKVFNGSGSTVDASNSSASNPTVRIVNNTNLGSAIDLTGGLKVSGTNKTAFKVVTGPFISGNKSGIVNTSMANAATDILIVTYEYTGGSYLNKQFATFWNGGNWEIHLTDGTAMPSGITFNVLVIKQ